MSKWVLNSVKSLCLVFLVGAIVACGAGTGELSQGEPLQDALARFNMAIQSGDESTALELVSESERELLTQDGFTFAEKYRKGAQRLRLSTLMNNKELALDSDDKIVGLMKILEEANTKGRRAKFIKRAGASLDKEDNEETDLVPVAAPSSSSTEPANDDMQEEAVVESNAPEAVESPEATDAIEAIEAPEETNPVEAQDVPAAIEEPAIQEEPVTDEDGFVEF